jgi:aminocarboxymuconate-semialdehyde decarboxylase
VIVDVHAHVIVGDASPPASAVGEFTDPDGILAAADRAGIDRVVLSPWVRLLDGDAEHCRVQNEALVALRCDRIGVLGSVPLREPAQAAEMLRGLPGVEIPASVDGDYLGHDRFEPFWTAAEETGALVFIHPTTRAFDWPDYHLWNTVGNPFETTVTAAHMVMAGVMERHPALRVVLAHGGGALPVLRGRLRHAHEAVATARTRLTEPPEESLKRFYFDTVTHDPQVLRDLADFAGADHVLLGTDQPFDMADPDPVATVRRAGLDPHALGANAEALLG